MNQTVRSAFPPRIVFMNKHKANQRAATPFPNPLLVLVPTRWQNDCSEAVDPCWRMQRTALVWFGKKTKKTQPFVDWGWGWGGMCCKKGCKIVLQKNWLYFSTSDFSTSTGSSPYSTCQFFRASLKMDLRFWARNTKKNRPPCCPAILHSASAVHFYRWNHYHLSIELEYHLSQVSQVSRVSPCST